MKNINFRIRFVWKAFYYISDHFLFEWKCWNFWAACSEVRNGVRLATAVHHIYHTDDSYNGSRKFYSLFTIHGSGYGDVIGGRFEFIIYNQISKCVWLLLMVPCLDSIFPDSILTYSKERFIFLDVMHFYAELILKPFKAYVIFALVFYHIQHNRRCYLLANRILVVDHDYELWYNCIVQ